MFGVLPSASGTNCCMSKVGKKLPQAGNKTHRVGPMDRDNVMRQVWQSWALVACRASSWEAIVKRKRGGPSGGKILDGLVE